MKNKIFLLILIVYSINSRAQLMVNGNFAINQNNDYRLPPLPTIGGAPTFANGTDISNGSVPNWYRSFGTPNFCFDLSNCPDPHGINFFTQGGTSEGIAGGYPFVSGETYIVHIGVDINNITTGTCMMYATAQLPHDDAQYNFCGLDDASGYPPITGNGTTSFGAGAKQELLPANLSTLAVGDNTFTFVANANYQYVWFYPMNTSCDYGQSITISYMYVTQQCQEDLYLASSSPEIALVGKYTYARNIYAGSGYGSAPTVPLPTTGLTILEATQQVILSNGFVANPDFVFLADINEYACDVIPPGDMNHAAGKMENPGTYQQLDANQYTAHFDDVSVSNLNAGNLIDSGTSQSFILSPNPTSSSVTVHPLSGVTYPLTIMVSDIAGRTIMTRQFTNNEMKIDLSEFAPGLYLFNIQSASGIHTYKVTKY